MGKKIRILNYYIIRSQTILIIWKFNRGKKITRGFEEFKKGEKFWGNPDFKAIKYDIRDLKISLSKTGDAAWFYCVLDDINEWKGEPANWLNTRWTGVLEKRERKWVIVQMHFSFSSDK